ncbi:hypothetical protein JXB27_00180 [Candidatus Woesearchaeota archaeon]|nr:hypothetical protein [Candidatus Woesearchaeota archaeon]
MEVKKILRKATALAASASFVGATLLGAVAQDLANYPAPFVENGVFDAFIVVGQNAMPEDIVGAVDIGTSLQFALKKATTVSAGASEATISEGYKVQKSGNKLNYSDSIRAILGGTAITEEDIPTVLADGKFVESEGDNKNSEGYSQDLRFHNGDTAMLVYAQEDELAPKAGDYFFIDRGEELYNYSLEFDSSIDFDNTSSTTANDDLKTATINIMGKVYTITDVEVNTAGEGIKKLTLLSGEAVLWLTQNQPITKAVSGVEHTIEVLDVTEDADACQVKVDDARSIIDVDETRTINGVQVGITDVRAIHAQLQDVDVCQVSIGASEVILDETQSDGVKVDDVDIDGSTVVFDSKGSTWDGFEVVLTPKGDTLKDDKYLAKGEAYTDPIFGSWKIAYGGIVAEYETYTAKTAGDSSASFKFINNDGKEVEIPMYVVNGTTVILGEGDEIDERVYSHGADISVKQSNCSGAASVEECDGMMILATTANGEAHVFEVSIDTDQSGAFNGTLDLKDLTYGKNHEDIGYMDTDITDDGTQRGVITNLLDLGSFGTTINVTINESADWPTIIVNQAVDNKIETLAGASIYIDDTWTENAGNGGNVSISIDETDSTGNTDLADEANSAGFNITATVNADEEIQLDVVLTGAVANSIELEDDSDDAVDVTGIGTIVTADVENKDMVTVQMPKAEVYGNVFIAPIVAEMSTAGGGIPTYTLSKLNVGAAKLDSEVSDVAAQNLIVVGGPCANKVTAQVLGLTYPACGADSGIAENTGIIKEVVQSSGKVALVVAGWNAADTRRATRVMYNYDTHQASGKLAGSSVTVTGTSMTDISIAKSA